MKNSLLNSDRKRVRIDVGETGRAELMSIHWFKLLLRLRQLPDGCHSLMLVKDGDECQWSIMNSGKVES